MSKKRKEINFSQFGGPVYSGRGRGDVVRKSLKLDEEDKDKNLQYVVIIPDSTLAITSSFFLEMFASSIQKCGSVASFKERFDFSRTPEKLMPVIENSIKRALADKEAPYV